MEIYHRHFNMEKKLLLCLRDRDSISLLCSMRQFLEHKPRIHAPHRQSGISITSSDAETTLCFPKYTSYLRSSSLFVIDFLPPIIDISKPYSIFFCQMFLWCCVIIFFMAQLLFKFNFLSH